MKIGDKMKTVRLLKTKGGEVFATGTMMKLLVVKKMSFGWHAVFEDQDKRHLNVSFQLGHKIFNEFPKPPSIKKLEKWSSDGIAMSVGGKKVEPDGIDPDGMPSWLLVLGYI